jgi:hypothetical protein
VCRPIARNLRHRNKQTLNPHGGSGQPTIGAWTRCWGIIDVLLINYVTGITLRFRLCFLRIRLVFKGLQARLGC